ncbi:MAG: AtpZ/AtpI family protein [Bacteroidia bacterium]|nr:AtpZ/AtpI family protein [Bacteroidia bacterium]
MSDSKPNKNKDLIRYAGMGFEILAAMLICISAGYGLDKYFKTEIPWFTLVFSLLGCGIALYLMIRSLGNNKKS